MSRIDRYLIKEVMLAFIATVIVLLAMVLSHRLAGLLSSAASGALSRDAIFVLLGLQAIRLLVVLMPVGFLLGIMLALGRLYRDSEMTALTACGVGPGRIYRPLFMVAVPMALVLAGLSFYVVPWAVDLYFDLRFQARQHAQVSMLTPGQFREVLGGQHVIYIKELDRRSQELHKIFVQSTTRDDIAITTGERGYQEVDPESGARYVVIRNGHRYEGFTGRGDYRLGDFKRLAVRVDTGPVEEGWSRRETLPTQTLVDSPEPWHRAELHARIGGPLSLLLLTGLAPLLARSKPREGRYGRVVAAILVYTIYINLLSIGEAWLGRGYLWPWLGLWWVHALVLLFLLGLWTYQYGLPLKRPVGSGARQ